jgi:ribosomal protein S18
MWMHWIHRSIWAQRAGNDSVAQQRKKKSSLRQQTEKAIETKGKLNRVTSRHIVSLGKIFARERTGAKTSGQPIKRQSNVCQANSCQLSVRHRDCSNRYLITTCVVITEHNVEGTKYL